MKSNYKIKMKYENFVGTKGETVVSLNTLENSGTFTQIY